MKKTVIFLIAGLIVAVAVFALGSYMGYRYAVENCAPTYGEFRELEEFNRLLVEEVEKIRDAQPIGIIPGALCETEMNITPKGAVWHISSPKRVDKNGHWLEVYEKTLNIRKDISQRAIVWKNGQFAGHNYENLRPLAKWIAEGIFEASKQRYKTTAP